MSIPTVYGPSRDGRHAAPLTQAQRLAADAAAAAEVRAYQNDPHVVALRVERIRTHVDRLMWAGIVLGLCFTMTNVQQFAAAGAPVGSLAWWSAWLLDPMVSLVLLAVLRAEQVTTRYQVSTGPWPRLAKWALLGATYVMNTWVYWAAGSASGVVLHSVPPLVVVIAAEVVTDLQYALTECVHRAHTVTAESATQRPELVAQTSFADSTDAPAYPVLMDAPGERPVNAVSERSAKSSGDRPAQQLVNAPIPGAGQAPRTADRARRKRRSRAPMRRKLLADYLAEARGAWRPGVVVTPAWVRQVTDCSRGLSSKVAAALNAELTRSQNTTTSRTEPEGRAA